MLQGLKCAEARCFHGFYPSNPSKSCSTSYAIDSSHPSNYNQKTRAAQNNAKNNVTSRVRLDEKYYDRRAVQELAKSQ
jgi:hypothetical protein